MKPKRRTPAYNHGVYIRRRQKVFARMAARKAWLSSLKTGPCLDCGVSYPPYVMHFDHRDPKSKQFQIAQSLTRAFRMVLKEIAKCDLVCANCHAERTHRRKV